MYRQIKQHKHLDSKLKITTHKYVDIRDNLKQFEANKLESRSLIDVRYFKLKLDNDIEEEI